MNIVDLLFIVLLITALAIGMFQGTLRLLIAVVVLYISILLASLYFQPLGNVLRIRFNSTIEVSQIVAFAVILLVAFIMLLLAGLYTFRYARIPTSLEFIDRVLGTLLGMVLGALILGMFAVLLRDLFVFQSPATTLNYPFMQTFQDGVRSSILVRTFNGYILPLIYRSIDPILPPEANIIFQLQ